MALHVLSGSLVRGSDPSLSDWGMLLNHSRITPGSLQRCPLIALDTHHPALDTLRAAQEQKWREVGPKMERESPQASAENIDSSAQTTPDICLSSLGHAAFVHLGTTATASLLLSFSFSSSLHLSPSSSPRNFGPSPLFSVIHLLLLSYPFYLCPPSLLSLQSNPSSSLSRRLARSEILLSCSLLSLAWTSFRHLPFFFFPSFS